MTTVASTPPPSTHHLPVDAFAGAERVVFEQSETFSAAHEFVLPSLEGVDPEAVCGAAEHAHVESEYFDTADLTLARAGISVRHGVPSEGWTVVLPTVSSVGEPIRREARYAGPAGEVPQDALRLVHGHLHGRPVARVARVVTERVTTPLVTRAELHIADVVDERTVATREDGREERFRDVDVKVFDLDGVGHLLLSGIRARLESAGCRLEPARSDLARAFGLTAD